MTGPLRLAVVMLAAALLAACGADQSPSTQQSQDPALTHEQYQQEILAILGSAEMRSASQLFTDTVANEYGRAQCSSKVRAFHDDLVAIVDRVQRLRPPPDAAEAQRDFLAGAEESVRLVGVAADDVAKGTLTCGQKLNARIYGLPSTARAEAALSKLTQNGYLIGGE